jgi:hypothetical protein
MRAVIVLIMALATPPKMSAFCRTQIHFGRLPANDPQGKWSVSLDVGHGVLKRHGKRFRSQKIEPNGEAWAGVLQQCLPKNDLDGIELDPEAGSLHAWVDSDAAKDRWVAALCRAVDDRAWLDQCLASVDRSKLDD